MTFVSTQLGLPPPQDEILTGRTRNGKQYRLPDGRKKVVAFSTPIHYQDGGGPWQDIDLTPRVEGDDWVIDKAPYILRISRLRPEITWTSRANGAQVRTALSRIKGAPLPDKVPAPVLNGNWIEFRGIRPGLDIKLLVRTNRVEWFKTLHNVAAPNEVEWEIERDVGFIGTVGENTVGWDAGGGRSRIEMVVQKTPPVRVGNKDTYRLTERFTGRVSRIVDPATRRREFKTDVLYPVEIDVPDITEDIAANSDDATSINTTQFLSGYGPSSRNYLGTYAGGHSRAGARFQTLAIDQGATIDLAELKLQVRSEVGTPNNTIWADDVDDAPTWSTSSRISAITKTTASAAFNPVGTGQKVVDVTSLVQEIVDRGSWANNNDLRFGMERVGALSGFHYLSFDDTSSSGTPVVARLEVTLGSAAQTVILDLVTETDTTLALTPVGGAVSVALDLVTETDTALALTPVGGAVSVALDLVEETDVALDMTVGQSVTLDLVEETDAALALTPVAGGVSVALDLVEETDIALDLTPVGDLVVVLDLVEETDQAIAITAVGDTVPGGGGSMLRRRRRM